jgi:hypothetical protein
MQFFRETDTDVIIVREPKTQPRSIATDARAMSAGGTHNTYPLTRASRSLVDTTTVTRPLKE